MGRQGVLYGAVCVCVMLVLAATAAQAQDYVFITKWGSYGSGDGQFHNPHRVAVDTSGNVYVADTLNDRIQTFAPDGSFLAKWGSQGSGDAQFNNPYGVAVDASGNVYVADLHNHRIQKFASDGSFLAKWGSQGSGNGQLKYPTGVAIDASGNVYVADFRNHRIQKFAPANPPANQLDDLAALIRDRVASGDVASQMENSLIAKVEGAMAALARRKPGAIDSATGKLQALINQVEAQSGKKIDAATAEEIIERAERIIAELGVEPQSLACGGEAMITNVSAVPTAAGAQIVFTTSADTVVSVEVLNIAGRCVRHVVTDRVVSAGVTSLSWNACSDSGPKVPSGTYLVRVTAAGADGSMSQSIGTVVLRR